MAKRVLSLKALLGSKNGFAKGSFFRQKDFALGTFAHANDRADMSELFSEWLIKGGVTLPTYADSATAAAAGAPVGSFFKTATGEILIVVA